MKPTVQSLVIAIPLLLIAAGCTDGGPPRSTDTVTTEIDGTWTIQTTLRNGVEQPLDTGQRAVSRFENGHWFPGRDPNDSTPYRLNPDVDPKQIDIMPSDSPPMLGLYAISNEQLVLAFNGPGQPRPEAIDSQETPPYFKMIFRKTQ